MSIIIQTKDDKQIVLNNINPYLDLKLITSLINETETEETNDNKLIELKEDYEIKLDVKYSTLMKLLEYALHNYEIKDLNITEQDKFNYINDYLDCKNEDLCDLLNAADYLQYDILVDLICEKIADDIHKCDNLNSLKKKFNIKNIISDEQEQELLEQIK